MPFNPLANALTVGAPTQPRKQRGGVDFGTGMVPEASTEKTKTNPLTGQVMPPPGTPAAPNPDPMNPTPPTPPAPPGPPLDPMLVGIGNYLQGLPAQNRAAQQVVMPFSGSKDPNAGPAPQNYQNIGEAEYNQLLMEIVKKFQQQLANFGTPGGVTDPMSGNVMR